MLKAKATKKAVNNGFVNKVSVGYCQLQNLLDEFDPSYYTAGVNGWGADVYVVNNNTAVVTGYAPFGNVRPNLDLVQRYDAMASSVSAVGEARRVQMVKLLNEFVKEALQDENKR